jgi:RecA/RadA recombinase
MRVDVRRRQLEKVEVGPAADSKTVVVGQTSKLKFVKNKVGRPFGECEFTIWFDKNLTNPITQLCDAAYKLKPKIVYKNSGLWRFKLDGEVTPTPASDMIQLAKWVHENGFVSFIQAAVEEAMGDSTPDYIREIDENTLPPDIECPVFEETVDAEEDGSE